MFVRSAVAGRILATRPTPACFIGYDSRWGEAKRAQPRAAAQATPASIGSSSEGTPAVDADLRTLRVRFLASPAYLTQTIDAPHQIGDLLEDANRVLVPRLGLRLALDRLDRWAQDDDEDLVRCLDACAPKTRPTTPTSWWAWSAPCRAPATRSTKSAGPISWIVTSSCARAAVSPKTAFSDAAPSRQALRPTQRAGGPTRHASATRRRAIRSLRACHPGTTAYRTERSARMYEAGLVRGWAVDHRDRRPDSRSETWPECARTPLRRR
jgi:hypothetical protein